MDHYLMVAENIDYAFSTDAYLPIINGKKGNTSVQMKFQGNNGEQAKLVSFQAGLRANMVPQDAIAIVEVDNPEELIEEYYAFLENAPISGDAAAEGNEVTLTLVGKAAHGSTPEHGVNAATHLATFLFNYDFDKDAKAFLIVLANYLYLNHDCIKLVIDLDDVLFI